MIDKLSNCFSDIVEGLTPKHVFLLILAVEAVLVWVLWTHAEHIQAIAAATALGSFFYWTIARFSRRLITATRHWHPLASSSSTPLDFDRSKEILIGEEEKNRLKGVFDSIKYLIPSFYTKNKTFFENVLAKKIIKGNTGFELHDLLHNAEVQVDASDKLTRREKLRGTRFLRCSRIRLFVGVVPSYKREKLPIFYYLLGIPTLYDEQEEDC